MKGGVSMERLKGMLYGSFIGDAFSLNANWVYDTEKLLIEASTQDDYINPSSNPFYTNKHKGELTHYGDQSLLLLKSISSNKGFELDTFKLHWITFVKKYEGYLDHATKESIELLDSHSRRGSSSDELGGYARCFPLIFYHFDDPKLHSYMEQQTRMTHDNDSLIEISHFITDLILEIIIGKSLELSIQASLLNHPKFKATIDRIKEHLEDDTIDFVKDIGQGCVCEYAFPASLYICLKYSSDFKEALRINNLCGGDSASRGLIIGALLGALNGFSSLPQNLIKHLACSNILEAFTDHKRL